MEINNKVKIMIPGDKQEVFPKDKHRFTGLEDSELIELLIVNKENDTYRDKIGEKINELEFKELLHRYEL